jgi:hypothetical protein
MTTSYEVVVEYEAFIIQATVSYYDENLLYRLHGIYVLQWKLAAAPIYLDVTT